MIIKRQKEFVQAAALTIPYQTTFPVQEQTTVTQNKAPRFLRKARVSVYKTGKALNNAAWNLKLNPQETIKRGIKSGTEYAAKYPLVATGKSLGIPISSAVGYAIAGPEGMLYANASPVGVGTMIASVDPILHKTSPKYDRITKKASEAVKNSKGFDQALDSIVGRDPQVTFRNSGPHAPFSEKLKYNIQSGVADISKGIQGAGKSVVKLLRHFSEEEEREYSYKSAKKLISFRAGLKGLGNKIMTPINNAGLKVGNTAKEIVTGKPTPQHMKIGFRPKTKEQLKTEAVKEAKAVRNKAKGVINEANMIKDSAIMDPGGTAGQLINQGVIQRASKSPVSAVMPLAPIPGATSTSIAVAPLEQKVWDQVNRVGVGKYTIGRVVKPVKKFVREDVNKNAANVGRAVYNQIGLIL